jgi:hypothetical protein
MKVHGLETLDPGGSYPVLRQVYATRKLAEAEIALCNGIGRVLEYEVIDETDTDPPRK